MQSSRRSRARRRQPKRPMPDSTSGTLLREADRAALAVRWREPHRHYHTMQHLEECLALFSTVRAEAARPAEVEAALWLHDAVYDPRSTDNEERSAALGTVMLVDAGAAPDAIERVRTMILATRHHDARIAEPLSTDDAALVCDIDLAILGADRERFEEYERQVRAEYAWVPASVYGSRRAEVLRGLAARPYLFVTASLQARFEVRARENIARSTARLEGGNAPG
jgi:predicted metal-dependent HD superfamily phosphohydrolase